MQVLDGYIAAVDCQYSLGLEAGKIAGNKLANGADLRGQFLVFDGQENRDTLRGASPFRSCQAYQERSEPMADGCERKLFNNSDKPSEASSDHAQHFEGHLGVS